MDLYLHIGTEKTGTTSIQRFMALNRSRLRSAGVLYPISPGDGNQRALAAISEDGPQDGSLRRSIDISSEEQMDAFRIELRRKLEEEVRSATDCTRAVMSNEHCSSRLRSDSEVKFLHDYIADLFDKIYIVVYLRRQDQFLLSTYSTMVKTGNFKLLALPQSKRTMGRYDHWALVARWGRIFGEDRIICRKYERESLIKGDVIDDFMTTVAIPPDPSYDRREESNESLDADALEFLRMLNRHFDRHANKRVGLVRTLAEISNGPLVTLPDEDLAQFTATYAEGNRRIAELYFGGARTDSDDPLFAPRNDSRPRRVQSPLSVDRVVELASLVWKSEWEKGSMGGSVKPKSKLPKEERAQRRKARLEKQRNKMGGGERKGRKANREEHA